MLPVKVEVGAIRHFSRAVWIDELQALPPTEEVHMGLESGDLRRVLQSRIPIVSHHLARGNVKHVDLAGRATSNTPQALDVKHMLGHLSFWIENKSELCDVRGIFAD